MARRAERRANRRYVVLNKETLLVVTPTATANVDVASPATSPRLFAPVPPGEANESMVFASGRSLALMVNEEEAEALMAVLLLAPLEGGRTGDVMDQVLSRLAEVHRAFSRAE